MKQRQGLMKRKGGYQGRRERLLYNGSTLLAAGQECSLRSARTIGYRQPISEFGSTLQKLRFDINCFGWNVLPVLLLHSFIDDILLTPSQLHCMAVVCLGRNSVYLKKIIHIPFIMFILSICFALVHSVFLKFHRLKIQRTQINI